MSMKNYSTLTLAAAGLSLAGCQQSEEPPVTQNTPQQEAEVRSQLSAESTELKAELARLQATDPSVKDIYYGVDESGNRVLHIVREQQAGESSEGSVWPLVAGMAAGALIGHMISSGGVNQYARHNPPARTTSYYSREDERRQRNVATSAYAGSVSKRLGSSIGTNTAKPATQISTRSSGVFGGGTSNRASSYSGGA